MYGCKCNYNINILVCIIFANNSSCFRQIAATNEPFSSKKHIAVTAFIRVYHFVRFTLRGTYTVIICNNIYIYIYSHVKCDYGKQKQAQTRTCRSWNVAWPQLTRASANAMNGIGRIWLPIQNPIYSIHKWSMKRFKKLPICRSQRPLPTQLLRSTTPGSSRNGHNCYFKDKKTTSQKGGSTPNNVSEWFSICCL